MRLQTISPSGSENNDIFSRIYIYAYYKNLISILTQLITRRKKKPFHQPSELSYTNTIILNNIRIIISHEIYVHTVHWYRRKCIPHLSTWCRSIHRETAGGGGLVYAEYDLHVVFHSYRPQNRLSVLMAVYHIIVVVE